MNAELLTRTLGVLKPGIPLTHRNLAIFPFFTDRAATPEYIMLDEAMDRNVLEITEVSEGGSVPDLTLENHGETTVLLLAGEQLVGAKQNRVLNVSILVPGKTRMKIPVSCVEAGRWGYRSRDFDRSDHTLFAKGRARMQRDISQSLREAGMRRSDQGAVWADVAAKASILNADSRTESMDDIYEERCSAVEEFVAGLQSAAGQVGALFVIGGEPRGFEYLDHPDHFAAAFAKIVRGYALDAIEPGEPDAPATLGPDTPAWLERAKAARIESYKAVGEGEEFRIEGGGIVGGALGARDRIVHMCLFQDPHAERMH